MEVVDGMLEQENAEMRERVGALERKLQLQEDEILCLKSALADCLRRLNAIDASGRFAQIRGDYGITVQSNVLPSKPNIRTPGRRSHSGSTSRDTSSRDAQSHSPRDVTHHQTHNTPSHTATSSRPSSSSRPSKSALGSSPNLKKWGSVPGANHSESSPSGNTSRRNSTEVAERRSGSMNTLSMDRKATSVSNLRSKEHTFNPDEGTLRFYLRGRPLTLYAPSGVKDYDVTSTLGEPEEHLKLEWVYGYRGRDARNNIFLLPTGELIYFVASAVVLYNVDEQMQRHYLGHTDDVKSIAVHPDRITIATGQVAGHEKREGKVSPKDAHILESGENTPHIRIWDSVSLNTLKVIGIGEFERSVACISFSKTDGGQYLVAVDESNEHVVSLWDWQRGDKGYKITETKSSTEPVLVADFHPCENNCFITCGKSQLNFWYIEGGTLSRKQGLFERNEKPKFVTCLAFAENGDLITGDSNGNLFVWPRGTNKISATALHAHEGGIFSICVLKDGTLITGGRDRRIVEWTSDYQATGNEHEIPEQYGAIRMLTQGKGNIVIAGTTRNCILQGTLDLKFSAIVQGHMDELWGLSAHPNQHHFMTCGYDKTLFLWDTLSHSAVWSMELPDGAHCTCFHPEGNIVVVGSINSRWFVIEVETRDIVTSHSDGNEAIECVEFSPDGQMLALGSRDNYIYIYGVSEAGHKYNRIGRCSGHSSFVTHLDWSEDSQFLQSNSGDYEILYWNAASCKQVTSASGMRDTKWATQNCTLGFSVCGIWPEGADGTDVNACSRSGKRKVIASADDFGKVNLYKYPCHQPKSACQTYGGHSSHVTNVKFIFDDTRLLSTGGKDTAVLQWQVVE